jgi:dTDP-4-amino-4,6-dideoxygalactose transaminase
MSSPDITKAEIDAVNKVLTTRWLSMGPEHLAFEEAICDYTGMQYAIAVNSGTAGLHLCIRAADVGQGDLVITTPFSFVASSNAILFENAVPVFVDVDPQTGNMNIDQLCQAINDLEQGGASAQRWLPRKGVSTEAKLKAIMPIDVFGQPADMDTIVQVAHQHNLKVIEDACEAIGATRKGIQAGTQGDSAVFAFYPNKQITTAEGGVIVTNDEKAAKLMRALRNQGRAPGDTWLTHTYLGYNYRMDELSAALGRVQAGRLDELLNKRSQVANWYNQRLAELPLLEIPYITPETTRMSWFVYVIRISAQVNRDSLIHRLGDLGIPSRPYFAPIHLQPFMIERFGYQEGDYPVTENLGQHGVALPFSSIMTEDQVETVYQAMLLALTT